MMIDINTKSERTRNYLKAACFGRPDWIPCSVGIMPATWRKYRERLEEVLLEHPTLFPDLQKGQTDFDAVWDRRYVAGRFTDNWGCAWHNIAEGLDSIVVESPLAAWDLFWQWHAPDPITEGEGWGPPPDWERLKEGCCQAKKAGLLAAASFPHGFMYMRLYYLRGFENLMLDFAADQPCLGNLIEAVLDYNLTLAARLIECGVEIIYFGDDLGTQRSLPISPVKWRKHLRPCYERILGLCKEHDVIVSFHSDGYILDIIPDLIDCGVTVMNPQVGPNGLEGLERTAKGRVCINLDLNRQLFPFLTPKGMAEHVREAACRLALPEGGLMLYAECEPDVPLANIRAICETFEEVGGPA